MAAPTPKEGIADVEMNVIGNANSRDVAQVKVPAFCLEQFARRHGLAHASGGQVHIGPAGEAVFEVPGGFAMANEDKFVHKLKRRRGG